MDNNLGTKNQLYFRILIVTAIIIIFNLVYLDIFMFRNINLQMQKEQAIAPYVTPDYANQACPSSCLTQIYQATASSKTILRSITPTKAPTNISIKAPAVTSISNLTTQAKEFFVPFGSGTNASSDWEDVAGLKASVDSSNYSSIKSVVFEVSVSIPTGNQTAYARLFNETDKHPVWFSDVSLEGGTPQLLISKPITLDSGNKIYKVQMKTSLKYQAVLNQARIHITTN